MERPPHLWHRDSYSRKGDMSDPASNSHPPHPPGLGWAMEGRGHRPGEAAKCSTSHFSMNRIFHLNCDKAQTYEDMMAVITTYGSRFYNTKKGRFIGQLKLLPGINIIPMKGQRL